MVAVVLAEMVAVVVWTVQVQSDIDSGGVMVAVQYPFTELGPRQDVVSRRCGWWVCGPGLKGVLVGRLGMVVWW